MIFTFLSSVLLKLVLLSTNNPQSFQPPIFLAPSSNVSLSSIYAHSGSYVTTVIAYDPFKKSLIENYSILSLETYPKVFDQSFFSLNAKTGKTIQHHLTQTNWRSNENFI
jgi:hypothetical protein